MADLNNVTVVGRVVRDAEMRTAGASVLTEFTVANNTGFGQYACVNFFKVVLWGKRATSLNPYLLKGKQVGVTGCMENKTWMDQNGVKHDSWTITANDVCLMANSQQQNAAPNNAPPGESWRSQEDDLAVF